MTDANPDSNPDRPQAPEPEAAVAAVLNRAKRREISTTEPEVRHRRLIERRSASGLRAEHQSSVRAILSGLSAGH